MKGYLFDTNMAVISLRAPERVPAEIQRLVDARRKFLSVISYWEITLKVMKGKLDVGNVQEWWPAALARLGAVPMPLIADHIAAIAGLPSLHHDPFDRVLIAQAIAEDLTLVTTDSEIPRYPVPTLYVP